MLSYPVSAHGPNPARRTSHVGVVEPLGLRRHLGRHRERGEEVLIGAFEELARGLVHHVRARAVLVQPQRAGQQVDLARLLEHGDAIAVEAMDEDGVGLEAFDLGQNGKYPSRRTDALAGHTRCPAPWAGTPHEALEVGVAGLAVGGDALHAHLLEEGLRHLHQRQPPSSCCERRWARDSRGGIVPGRPHDHGVLRLDDRAERVLDRRVEAVHDEARFSIVNSRSKDVERLLGVADVQMDQLELVRVPRTLTPPFVLIPPRRARARCACSGRKRRSAR